MSARYISILGLLSPTLNSLHVLLHYHPNLRLPQLFPSNHENQEPPARHAPVASLTWPSLRWGRRPRLPGRPQLRPVPRGPVPSGRTLRSLSSSSPCGPGNSPEFWLQRRWLPDRPAGCLEYRRLAWSRRSPEDGAGILMADKAHTPEGME